MTNIRRILLYVRCIEKNQCKKYQFKRKIIYFLGDLNFSKKEDKIFLIAFVSDFKSSKES
jgi:hypothetical protein